MSKESKEELLKPYKVEIRIEDSDGKVQYFTDLKPLAIAIESQHDGLESITFTFDRLTYSINSSGQPYLYYLYVPSSI